MKRILQFLILSVLTSTVYPQDYEKRVDDFLSTQLGILTIPNVEISFASSESILFSRSFGVKTTNSDLFFLGSVSKSLTALGVLKLIEGGNLDFERKLSEILPEIDYDEYASEITVRHLLNHTSGIPKVSGFTYLPDLNELSDSKFSLSVKQPPGEKHEYSNMNYSLLGLIIERSSGILYSEFLSGEVFAPLQMNKSKIYFSNQLNDEIVTQYQYWGPFPIKSNQVDYSATSIPAGFILSSELDMSNYLSMILSKGEYGNEKYIEPILINEMITPWDNSDFGYCMGWKKGVYNNKVIFQHLGSTATSYSAIFIIPEKNIGFTILTNTNSLSYTESIAEGILNILTDGENIEVSGTELYLRIGVILGIVLILVNLIVKVINQIKSKLRIESKKIFFSLGINIILIFALLSAFPRITNVPFLTFIKLQPDIGTLIILVLGSSLLLNVFRLIHHSYLKQ